MFTRYYVNYSESVRVNDDGHRAFIKLDDGSFIHVERCGEEAWYTLYRTVRDLADKTNPVARYDVKHYVNALRSACEFAIGYNASYHGIE